MGLRDGTVAILALLADVEGERRGGEGEGEARPLGAGGVGGGAVAAAAGDEDDDEEEGGGGGAAAAAAARAAAATASNARLGRRYGAWVLLRLYREQARAVTRVRWAPRGSGGSGGAAPPLHGLLAWPSRCGGAAQAATAEASGGSDAAATPPPPPPPLPFSRPLLAVATEDGALRVYDAGEGGEGEGEGGAPPPHSSSDDAPHAGALLLRTWRLPGKAGTVATDVCWHPRDAAVVAVAASDGERGERVRHTSAPRLASAGLLCLSQTDTQ